VPVQGLQGRKSEGQPALSLKAQMRKPPVDWVPGSEARLTYEHNDGPWRDEEMPVPGDLLASEAGASYVIEEVHRVRGNPKKLRLVCARLDYGSISPEDAEVHGLYWGRR
jgi:hypothetical protein